MKPLRVLLLAFLLVTLESAVAAPADPYLWLESLDSKPSMDWVRKQDAVSVHALAASPSFETMNARFLSILNSDAQIPYVTLHGGLLYNLWHDSKHERGLWRRTTLAEYRKSEPAWETVLDIDSLAASEKENWFWGGADVLPTDSTLALVSLSRGGADAHVVREFDLARKEFVKGGFELPESKGDLSWVDRDHVYVGMALDSTTMTTSGYPRVVKEWTRGTPLASAQPVYEDDPTDVYAAVQHDFTPGFERDFAFHGVSFYSNELFLLRDGKRIKIEKPDDAEADPWREWLLLQLRTDWTVGGRTYKAGSLLAANFEDFLAGRRDLQVLFEPTDRTALAGFSGMRSEVLVQTLDNVRTRIAIARPEGGTWKVEPVSGLPEFSTIAARPVDARLSDDYWLTVNDFLTPPTFELCAAGGAPEKLKQSPSFFDASHAVVSQHEAISKDGTHVPYFEIAPKDLVLDGHAPTLLTGYGGFEIPLVPYYNAVDGSGWIARGGVYVVANIRGGGEFGPRWHHAALRENRPRAYEDFIAVAEDLVKRKVTSPPHLGCVGGSNGGLLVGNMLTMRPDLFGAIVCQSPLLDMHRYHKLLAGASWMSEYGNPDDPKDWAFIKTFSPYENVKKDAKYPPVLFTSSLRDDRVHPGHARKMVAKMEAQGHDVLYYENIEGGHGGAANNKESAYQSALTFTFLWKKLGTSAQKAAASTATHGVAGGKTGAGAGGGRH